MARAFTRFLLGACFLLAVGCVQPDAGPQLTERRFFAMGTWVDVSFVSPSPVTSDAALADIESTLRTFEREYYPWTDGELARVNEALAGGREIVVSAGMARLLGRARELSRTSGGLFEPGLGNLVELWGFHTTARARSQPPSAEAIAATLDASGGIDRLEIDGRRIRSTARGLKLDLGGIAKGAAVRELLASLELHGIDSALINAGGDLAVAGRPADDRPWLVGIREPRGDGLLGILALGDGEAAFTSGDYERFYEYEGQRFHHLLDPETGLPVGHTQALTVIDTDPTRADAAATALFVAGPSRWRMTASRLGVDAVLRVDASGAVELTAAMAARLDVAEPEHDIIISSGQESPL